jgi:photosystem II stability/assembly factor-like uncharacterized protein
MSRFFEKPILLLLVCACLCLGQSKWVPGIVFPKGNNLYCITYANNKFVVVSDSGRFITTPDLATWTIKKSNTDNSFHAVAYGNGNYVAVGYGGTIATLSDPGVMTVENSGTTQWLTAVTYGGGQFVVAGVFGHVLTSPDAKNWLLESAEVEYQYSVVYANDTFMIVGNGPIGNGGFGGMIRKSPYWMVRDPGIPLCMLGVMYAAGRYVVVGDEGIIYSSNDGAVWTKRNSGTTAILRSITYGAGSFVAVGDTGTILTSPDGAVWTKMSSHTTYPLYSVTYGANAFVVVGPGGIVVISQADNTGLAETAAVQKQEPRPRCNVSADRIVLSWPDRAHAIQNATLYNGAGKAVYNARPPKGLGVGLSIPRKRFAPGIYYMSIVDQSGSAVFLPLVLAR